MYDVNFYMKAYELEKALQLGMLNIKSDDLLARLEEMRSIRPVVFNIETTNACNMQCKMCPRTAKMIRKVATMTDEVFEKTVEGLKPHSEGLWDRWKDFCKRTYGISEDEMGENHFYLYVSSKCITLHGYGEPVLDKKLSQKIQLLTDKHMPTYFSMNPANINIKQLENVFEAGLDYLKFSVDSIYNIEQVRGSQAKFAPAKIRQVIKRKNECGYKTVIVLTMIQFSEGQKEECEQFLNMFKQDADYIYIKSLDNRWMYHNKKVAKQHSLHWTTLCKMPWSSTSVLSRGYVVPCHQIYNVELVLGDVKYDSLSSVWNGEGYKRFRKAHVTLDEDMIDKCVNRCDMKLFGEK